MLKSMTGFGRGSFTNEGREYIVEIKAINHKYSDVNVRIPRQISYLEDKVRKYVLDSIARGKVDIFITFNNYSNLGRNIKIDKALAQSYINEFKNLANEYNIIDDISTSMLSRIPDVVKITNDENDEEILWEELKNALKDAIMGLITMRVIEGEKLKEDILKRLELISARIVKIEEYSECMVEEYMLRLENRIKELMQTNVVDETRLAQEIVIYSDKCSIEEELTRFKSHINQLKQVLELNDPVGKKIDFIIQEMNRETNTIGSKANNLNITKEVVAIKTEIENIREQIQNIE